MKLYFHQIFNGESHTIGYVGGEGAVDAMLRAGNLACPTVDKDTDERAYLDRKSVV